MMLIKTKRLTENAELPSCMHTGDAGFDIKATSVKYDEKNDCTIFGTGLAFEVPHGYAMFIFPRSSSYKNAALMANCVAVIDSGYRGEVHVIFKGHDTKYKVGDRIAQAIIMPIPHVGYLDSDFISSSDRGEFGLGSTGNN